MDQVEHIVSNGQHQLALYLNDVLLYAVSFRAASGSSRAEQSELHQGTLDRVYGSQTLKSRKLIKSRCQTYFRRRFEVGR